MYAVKTGKFLHLRRMIRTANRAVLPSEVAATNIQSSADRFISPLDFYSLLSNGLKQRETYKLERCHAALRHRHWPGIGG
jgi:hypothetical protein